MVPCRVGAGQTKYRNLRGFVEVGEDLASRKKAPETGDEVAAGPGFEPGLSDLESVSINPWLFAVVHPRNCQISVKNVSNALLSFGPRQPMDVALISARLVSVQQATASTLARETKASTMLVACTSDHCSNLASKSPEGPCPG